MYFGKSKNSVVQQGRKNAPVIAIKIYQCKIAAKPRPPGVETPGYYLGVIGVRVKLILNLYIHS
jgi:hypothetical protein